MADLTDRILSFLRRHPEGADDDELARALNLTRRQTANATCHRMAVEGWITRCKTNGKIQNFLAGTRLESPVSLQPQQKDVADDRPWFWEGNIQATVVKYLREQGYTITHFANTAAKERGIDIEAAKDDRALWVTVKGYPVATVKTPATMQASHWFKDAFFDIIKWRGEYSDVELALALPNYPRYRKFAARVEWLKPTAQFSWIWVEQMGKCTFA
jgi:hypothetical protein